MDEISLIEMRYPKSIAPGMAPQLLSLGQDEIKVGRARVGYVLRKPGSPIMLIAPLDESTKARIRKAVAERDGTDPEHMTIAEAPVLESRPDDT